MKKLITTGIAALLISGAGVTAAQADPPNEGFGNFGLCNAYYQGSARGQEQKRAHGAAFQSLEQSADKWAEDTGYDGEDNVRGYCDANFPKPGNGNGNPGGGRP